MIRTEKRGEAAGLQGGGELPTRRKSTNVGPAAMGAAGLAPLAIALLVGNATIPSSGSKVVSNDPVAAAKCEEGLENFHECHASYPTGCSPTGRYDGYLNYLKNQHPPRNSTPAVTFTSLNDYHDLESRTPTELAKSNHADLKDKLPAKVEGQPAAPARHPYYLKKT